MLSLSHTALFLCFSRSFRLFITSMHDSCYAMLNRNGLLFLGSRRAHNCHGCSSNYTLRNLINAQKVVQFVDAGKIFSRKCVCAKMQHSETDVHEQGCVDMHEWRGSLHTDLLPCFTVPGKWTCRLLALKNGFATAAVIRKVISHKHRNASHSVWLYLTHWIRAWVLWPCLHCAMQQHLSSA